MGRVPRHEFVPGGVRLFAYDDRPVPISLGQTISQPYIVALMTDLAAVGRGSHVLEIGTGSGYQAAVLAELGADVYSIEILGPLRERAVEILSRLGYGQVKTRVQRLPVCRSHSNSSSRWAVGWSCLWASPTRN